MKFEDTEEFKELKSKIPAEKMDDFMDAFKKCPVSQLSLDDLDNVSGGNYWEKFKEAWWPKD